MHIRGLDSSQIEAASSLDKAPLILFRQHL
jgi:hypothetical protein